MLRMRCHRRSSINWLRREVRRRRQRGWGGGVGTVGEHDGGTNDNVSIFDGECGAPNVSIDAMSEGDAEGV
jgi:hypothetical protein